MAVVSLVYLWAFVSKGIRDKGILCMFVCGLKSRTERKKKNKKVKENQGLEEDQGEGSYILSTLL